YEFFRLLPTASPAALDRMYRDRTVAAVERHPKAIAAYLVKSSLYLLEPTMNKPLGHYHYLDTLRPGFWRTRSRGEKALYAFYLANSAVELAALLAMLALIAGSCLPGHRSRDPAQRGF